MDIIHDVNTMPLPRYVQAALTQRPHVMPAVVVTGARQTETVIPVRLRRQEVEEVKRVAKTRGVREVTLLRQWVLEKLRNARS